MAATNFAVGVGGCGIVVIQCHYFLQNVDTGREYKVLYIIIF
jgi:hypothetical protein